MNKVPRAIERRQQRRIWRLLMLHVVTMLCAAGVGVPVFFSLQTLVPTPVAVFSSVGAAVFAYLQVRPDAGRKQ